jgi:uncharacterized membrane protein (UPF0182 family)
MEDLEARAMDATLATRCFGKDISFYLLVLPWYDAVVSTATIVLAITIALWTLIDLGSYPSSARPWNNPTYRLGWGN